MTLTPKSKSILFISLYILLMIIAAFVFATYVDQDQLQSIAREWGIGGIFLFGLIEIFYVTFTPLLNTGIYVLSGYIFGAPLGSIINFCSTAVGLLLIVYLVKRFGRPMLQKFISERFYTKFDSITQKIGPFLLLVVYVIPFTPDDELTYILAAGPLSMKRFILPILFGTIAKSTLAYVGAQGTEGIAVAAYARVVMLILGLIAIAIQEYVVYKTKKVG